MNRQILLQWCEQTLQTSQFQDYAPNGLQVEGTTDVQHIITAVTASRAAIDFAVQQGAQMLLVHHGMFWKSEPVTITGWKRQRIATLLEHNINLVAYHLPLDAHPTLGNNAQLAKKMGWLPENTFGEQNLLNIGTLPENQHTAIISLLSPKEFRCHQRETVANNQSNAQWLPRFVVAQSRAENTKNLHLCPAQNARCD